MKRARSTPDHLLAQARVGAGTALSLEVAGGRTPDRASFRMEVDGETGALSIDGGAPRGFQSGRLTVSLRGKPQPVDEGEAATMTDEAANVASMYAALRDDILSGKSMVPDFDHAVTIAKLLDDVAASSRTGARKVYIDGAS